MPWNFMDAGLRLTTFTSKFWPTFRSTKSTSVQILLLATFFSLVFHAGQAQNPASPTGGSQSPNGQAQNLASPTDASLSPTGQAQNPASPNGGSLLNTGQAQNPASKSDGSQSSTGQPQLPELESSDNQAGQAFAEVGEASLAELNIDEVTAWVMREHPLALAAEAVAARGPAELLAARGAFDPTLQGDYSRKEYLGTEYYEYADAGLSWQSPYALKLEGGRQWAEGTYINPDRRVPAAGQAYLSLKLPLLQGLITDKYRIGLQQGRLAIYLNRAAAEAILNELRYDVSVAYLEWAYATRILLISQETEALIRQRLLDTRELYVQGDKPAVDTLEAAIALANQALTTQQALVDLSLAGQDLRALYWVLPEGATANLAGLRPALPLDTSQLARHPELRELRAQVAQQDLDRRLYNEYRKPQLDASYSILGDGFDLTPADSEGSGVGDLLTGAYKVGLTFRYPIFMRQARGQLQIAELKVAETGAKLEAKRQQLDAKARANAQAARAFEVQLTSVERLVDQTRALLSAERELFGLGESTQFLLNSREQSLQKALQTLAKIELSRAKAIFAYRQATATWP